MSLTPEYWEAIAKAIAEIPQCPSWLKEQGALSWDVVSQLPMVDTPRVGQPTALSVEQKVVRRDYLDFLREQIALSPRGPEWAALLQRRLTALEPFVGKPLLDVVAHCKPSAAALYINPESADLVHFELW